MIRTCCLFALSCGGVLSWLCSCSQPRCCCDWCNQRLLSGCSHSVQDLPLTCYVVALASCEAASHLQIKKKKKNSERKQKDGTHAYLFIWDHLRAFSEQTLKFCHSPPREPLPVLPDMQNVCVDTCSLYRCSHVAWRTVGRNKLIAEAPPATRLAFFSTSLPSVLTHRFCSAGRPREAQAPKSLTDSQVLFMSFLSC